MRYAVMYYFKTQFLHGDLRQTLNAAIFGSNTSRPTSSISTLVFAKRQTLVSTITNCVNIHLRTVENHARIKPVSLCRQCLHFGILKRTFIINYIEVDFSSNTDINFSKEKLDSGIKSRIADERYDIITIVAIWTYSRDAFYFHII